MLRLYIHLCCSIVQSHFVFSHSSMITLVAHNETFSPGNHDESYGGEQMIARVFRFNALNLKHFPFPLAYFPFFFLIAATEVINNSGQITVQ